METKLKWMIGAYVAAMVVANLTVFAFGPWFSPVNAFFLIGLDLTMRDKIHEASKGSLVVMGSVVVGGSLATYILNPAAQMIAIASAVSFGIAAASDWIAYSALRHRSYIERVNGSNVVGAAVDSMIFPTLAFGVLMPHIVALQFIAKVAGGAIWAIVLKRA